MSFKRHNEIHRRERTLSAFRARQENSENQPPSKSTTHVSERLGGKLYSCQLCSYVSRYNSSLTKHSNQCHPRADKLNELRRSSTPAKKVFAEPRKIRTPVKSANKIDKNTQTDKIAKTVKERKRRSIDININLVLNKSDNEETAVVKETKTSKLDVSSSTSESSISFEEVEEL